MPRRLVTSPAPARRPAKVALTISLLLVPAATATAQQADEWPGFRGRDGSGAVADRLDPVGLAPAVVWRAEVGLGYSGVTVIDGKAFTMFEAGDQFMIAFDAGTGAELWRRRVDAPYPGRDGSWNGPISTPAGAGNLIVGLSPWGRLLALDVADGEPVWEVHLADDLGAPRPTYGFASSPLVIGDVLVVHGGNEPGALLGLDLATGQVRWRAGKDGVDAQAPVRLTLAGREMVVAAGGEHVFGIDGNSGAVLWAYAHEGTGDRGQGSLVPVGLSGDRIFLAHDNDASQVIGIRAEGEGFVAEQVWTNRTIRNSYTVAVHHAGYIYAYSARILVCVDAVTGELKWRSRDPGDGFITLMGDHLIILTKDGTLHVVKASPDGYEELASGAIFDELTWTPVSVAYGDVFTRSLNEVVRISLYGRGSGDTHVAGVNFNVPRSLEPGDGEFGQFIQAVEAAADPAPVIDAFFAEHPEMPLIEGGDVAHLLYRGDDEAMAIAADFVGSRQEAPMVRVGQSDLFYYSARLLPDSRAAYAFVRDSETIRDPRNPLQTETLLFDADREFNFVGEPQPMSDLRMPGWRMPAHLRTPDAATRGTLEELIMASPFGEAVFQVYLPHGYADSVLRYPVIYFHGRTPRDLSALPTSLDNLIADGLAPVIAVFSERFLPPAPEYNAFWAEQLVPAVDERYRTIATAEGRIGIGGALGTLQALFIAFQYPELTSAVGIQSMFFLDTDWDRLVPFLKNASERPLRMYMDWGTYGMQNPQEAWDLRTESVRYWKEFEKLGFTLQGGEAPDGDDWVSWRNRYGVMLEALLARD